MAVITAATVDVGANGQWKAAQGTITADKPALNTTATWNSAGVTFTHLKANVTDTASAAASLLMDLQVGSVTKFNVTKAGLAVAAGGVEITGGTGATGRITKNATTGLQVRGIVGTGYDIEIANAAGSSAILIPTGTVNVDIAGHVTLAATKRLNLSATSFLYESASNLVEIVTNASSAFYVTATQVRAERAQVHFTNITTTASAANAYLESTDGNRLYRSTSSLRYKTLTGELTLDEAWRIVDGAKAITYTPKEGGREHIGLAAEWMHELDPRITTVDAQGRPDWVQYPHLTAPLMLALADVKRRMEAAGLWN